MYFFVLFNQKKQDIGILGFKKHAQKDEIELGVVIKQEYQNKGMSRAVKEALMQQIFLQNSKVSLLAFCHPNNKIPNRINAQLGFEFMGCGYYYGYQCEMNKWSMNYSSYSKMYID